MLFNFNDLSLKSVRLFGFVYLWPLMDTIDNRWVSGMGSFKSMHYLFFDP